jgi:predicted ATP-grasp superfamily ATP-dependent carboligase
MLLHSPASLPPEAAAVMEAVIDRGPDRGAVLVAALAGRALAQAARRAGYRPLVADLFRDSDTYEAAEASVAVTGGLRRGLSARAVLPALGRLAEGRAPIGLVYGAGFEDRLEILDAIAARWPLLGNAPATLERVKDPESLAALCRACDIPHPPIALRIAPREGAWLRKRRGGSGGTHIGHAKPGEVALPGIYFQRVTEGTPISAMLLADGRTAQVLGLSAQWPSPAPNQPYRFAGAVRPAEIGSTMAERLAAVSGRLVPAAGLVGLNSIDFVVRPDGYDLIEVNPRPGATLDAFRDTDGALFEAHVRACSGQLPTVPLRFPAAAATAIAYAERGVALPAGFRWPQWTADRQRPSIPVAAGGPLCSVLAEADTAQKALALAAESVAAILSLAGAAR